MTCASEDQYRRALYVVVNLKAVSRWFSLGMGPVLTCRGGEKRRKETREERGERREGKGRKEGRYSGLSPSSYKALGYSVTEI